MSVWHTVLAYVAPWNMRQVEYLQELDLGRREGVTWRVNVPEIEKLRKRDARRIYKTFLKL